MIERYSISASPAALTERFGVDVPGYYAPRYNAAPTQLLPVITADSPDGVSLFYWGRPPGWAKNKSLSERIINLPRENLPERPVLKKAMMKYRCIIPADGFYCWKKIGKKTAVPYRIIAREPVFSFAGLWEEFEDENGNVVHTFIIITTPTPAAIAKITERVPVMLTSSEEKIWLKNTAQEQDLIKVLNRKEDEGLTYYTVSPRIGEVDLDVPSLLTPTPPADQFGNLTLFD
jgi:putative SOS response-associated peptidase YedK